MWNLAPMSIFINHSLYVSYLSLPNMGSECYIAGGGPNPLSLKLYDAGQILESSTPIMMSISIGPL
jgi:hypothetical protein